MRAASREEREAVGALPLRIGIGKVAADVAEAGGAENRVGGRVAGDVAVGVAERARVERDRHAADDRAAGPRRDGADRSRCRRAADAGAPRARTAHAAGARSRDRPPS